METAKAPSSEAAVLPEAGVGGDLRSKEELELNHLLAARTGLNCIFEEFIFSTIIYVYLY